MRETAEAGGTSLKRREGASSVRFDPSRVADLLAILADNGERGEGRYRAIGNRLAELIGADGWFWARGHATRDPAGQVLSDVIDGGFADEAMRDRFLAALHEPELNAALFAPRPARGNDPCGEPVDDEAAPADDAVPSIVARPIEQRLPAGSALRRRWVEATGFDEGFLCEAPAPGTAWITAGFVRRPGKPPFSADDRCAAHLVVVALDVLRRPAGDGAASVTADALAGFRPRERQVLVYLVAGDSAKEIARKMGLSYHTITDYTKQIYRRLGIRSRAELLRRFLT